jgi:hypothetical protein
MPLADGLPAWGCTTACPHLIRTVKTVPWDPDDPEVEDDTSENHSYESIGRFFEARPVNPKAVAYAELDEISASHHRALDRKLDPDAGSDIPTLYNPL